MLLLWVLSALADDPDAYEIDALPRRSADRPAAVAVGPEALLASRSFTLRVPYRSSWRADHPEVAAGRLVALRVPAAMALVKDIGSPVLYADDRPAEVLTRRGACWVVVGPVTPLPQVVWAFGPATPPEAVTATDGARVRADAAQRGLAPLAAARTSPDLALPDADALWRAAEAMAAEACR